ncbi:MAG: hypothetical protein JSU07_03525 [Bacteroidetes bacterium]|nr:hypothetical protein [Bacteroidota bacterium]
MLNNTYSKFLIAFLLSCNSFIVTAQIAAKQNTTSVKYLQFSGVVLDQDSLTPIPLISIWVNDKPTASSDFYGFFTVVASPGDQITFTGVSHKNRSYKIPDTCSVKYYFAIQVLTKDTVQLQPVEVHPWPSKEEFKKAFLSLNLQNTDYDRAEKNMKSEAMTYLERNQTASASENYRNVMNAYYTKIYTAGQQPSINLLSPIAWAQFIDAWKKGKFKSKKSSN